MIMSFIEPFTPTITFMFRIDSLHLSFYIFLYRPDYIIIIISSICEILLRFTYNDTPRFHPLGCTSFRNSRCTFLFLGFAQDCLRFHVKSFPELEEFFDIHYCMKDLITLSPLGVEVIN